MPSSDRVATCESESVMLTQCQRVVQVAAFALEGSGFVVFTFSDGTSDDITAEQALEIGRLGALSLRMAEEEPADGELASGDLPEGGAAA
ncbi:hypothetical protein [Nocardia terpenica]|uniref:Uncharacterized protein n=1 Tax=Nocardia terpenica TaxID=455432 RepID=A0A164LDF7_9NOCA|nr:hypothetical protein [Nocardia terpenica]KZM72289.1 hypothetical protein AWN90_37065 [Nocardia terpenica]NQE86565.1 hypothetical protein [Nocardia terpenica]